MIVKINPDEDFQHRHKSDCERIQKLLLELGYASTLKDCADLWDDYSDTMAAGWFNLGEDDETLKITLKYLVEK